MLLLLLLMAFIVEHECYKQGIEYRAVSESVESSEWFVFFAETLNDVVFDDRSD